MITLEEVSEYLEQWKSYGEYGMALCVWHDDHSPSMSVSSHGYKCKSCLAHGSLEKLYQKVSGRVVGREKVYNPSAWIWKNWGEKYGGILHVVQHAHQQLVYNPGFGHYLEERKIDSQIKSGMFGFLDGYYTFPIFDEYGDVQGCVARSSPTIETKNNRYSVTHNCPVKIYVPSWRKVLKDESLYVCYGTLDAWTLHMAGYAAITGLSGQEFRPEHLGRFRKPIYIIPDKHEEKSALEVASRLGWRGMILTLDYRESCKDLNNIHVKFGLDTVAELIEKAKEKYKYV